MAGEIAIKLSTTGLAMKALILAGNRTMRWDGSALVVINTILDAAWATGMVTATEQQTSNATATGIYVGTFPVGITTAGEYTVLFYSGASPTPGQVSLGQQVVWWDGVTDVSPSDNIYTVDAKYTRDEGNTLDRYTAQWLKNGVVVLDGAITLPKLTVHKDNDSVIVNAKPMTERAAGNLVVYTASAAERLTVGEGARALFQATIDGAVRSWPLTISRDST